MSRVTLANLNAPALATWLMMVKHPEQGDEVNGKALCDEIRKALKLHATGTVCFFHDGTGMVNARIGYANAFKELDRELAERVTEVVCATPGPIPRMMLYTVATLSKRSWSIFRTRAEADLHMRMRGYSATDYRDLLEGTMVSLRVPGVS
ncbi:MAG TPA: hypothetical protein VF794_23005 [Archangium sp.]|jgi:hypothetical protein|uniref:hypothetical protein n=1 Tax=Archangium sp. TaxID=1872627 RepID=UPI002EDA6A11